MNSLSGRLFAALPYFGMAVALSLSGWTFVQSNRYRQETDAILSQTYEIQWRAAQIRERLLRVYGYLRLADETGKLDPDIDRQMALVSVNVAQLDNLPYLHRFFPDHETELLNTIRRTLEQKIAPLVRSRTNYSRAIDDMSELEQSMYEISSATVDHSTTLQQTAGIDIAASRNWFIFAIALGLGATLYLIVSQRYAFVRRRDQHMRSFASLFAHMTRSRVTALRLFLDRARPDKPLSHEMITAARGAAVELESITDSLLQLAYTPQNSPTVPLGQLLEDLAKDRPGVFRLLVDSAARVQPVPATPFRLLVNELIDNALAAISGIRSPGIVISATVKRRPFPRRNYLVFEVADKGAGMAPAIAEKATAPFFSTRAGNHTGLGLTACSQMVSTLRGKLIVSSALGHGTIVQVRIPAPSTAATVYGSILGKARKLTRTSRGSP